ncbi:MAG TPA: hypothetical protein VNI01_15880, partial [Elusimicrobiota bacterium]|nr:hypothetical protein [Elusimicrobiota bacterium]
YMPLTKYILFNNWLRAGLSLANAVFFAMGWLNFWSLLALSVVSAFQFSTLFVTDTANMTALVGKDKKRIRATEALIRIATIAVTVASGLFLGEHIITALGFMWTFVIVAALQFIPVFIQWWTLPSIGSRNSWSFAGIRDAVRGFFSRLGKTGEGSAEDAAAARKSALRYALNSALIAIGLGTSFFWGTPFPLIGVMLFTLLRSDIYKNVISKHAMLKLSLIFIMFTSMAEIPMRNSVLGAVARDAVGNPSAAAAYFGNLIAAFYMGQMPTGTGILEDDIVIKAGPVSFRLKTAAKWLGTAAFAAWSYFYLIPPGWIVAAAGAVGLSGVLPAGVLAAAGALITLAAAAKLYTFLHDLAPKVSDRWWMRLDVLAMLGMGLPLLAWGNPAVLFLSLFLLGLVHNPTSRTVSAAYSAESMEHAPKSMQYLAGIKSSFLNMATSTMYALYGLVASWSAGSHSSLPTWRFATGMYVLLAVALLVGSYILPFGDEKKAAEKKK